MTEFAHLDLTSSRAPNICSKCLGHALEHVPSGCEFVYCNHTEAGCMRRPAGRWITASEISAAEFRAAVLIAIAVGEGLYIDDQAAGMIEQ